MAGYTAIRNAFQEWAEEGAKPTEALDAEGESIAFEDVLETLEGSEDIMPSHLCDELDLERGSTYADGVEEIRRLRRLSG